MFLDIHSLSAGYGARLVLRDLSLRANGGEVLGVIGANGAGKSTLLRVISGTLAPKAGTIRLGHPLALQERGTGGEVELTNLAARQRAQRVAVVPQGAHLPEAFSVMEVVLLGRTPLERSTARG